MTHQSTSYNRVGWGIYFGTIQNSSRDNDPLFLFTEKFHLDIWSEFKDTTELEGIIHYKMKNYGRLLSRTFQTDDAASVLNGIGWIFKMASFMNIFYSEMITMYLPFQKNDR